MDESNDPNLQSFLPVAPTNGFPIQNLPFAIASRKGCCNDEKFAVTRIGDTIIHLGQLEELGFFDDTPIGGRSIFSQPYLNDFLEFGNHAWIEVRKKLIELFKKDNSILRDHEELKKSILFELHEIEFHLPVRIGDYTDFYSSKQHATNVGIMFRGKENALMPNWLYLPVAYHGRSSSIVISHTSIKRPYGQIKPQDGAPIYSASKRLDFELEVGAIVGIGNPLGQPIPVDDAENHIFGLMLVNDWSARDIQQWEYQPLGPFLGKNFATSISPWIVTMEALKPFRCSAPIQEPKPLTYLQETERYTYDIQLEIELQTKDDHTTTQICSTNFNTLYWTLKQQIAHHTINGCNLRTGDLLASGTISGDHEHSYGSLLELTWNGKNPIHLNNGKTRTFLEDGDTVIIRGYCQNKDYTISFGEVVGTIVN
ncbi:MAG: fumarylacetoacetase [bacterium]|nr:fumarylacetoacetase [bacterium]